MQPDETCIAEHDWFTALLTTGLIAGLLASYVPQHFRIINKNSSEGFSPWFLLLGSTSSASGMLNMITMQWSIIRCCSSWSVGSCIEMTAGVFQVTLQWLLFTIILVLYMLYYPRHLKHVELDVDFHDSHPPHHIKTPVKSDDWRLSITLSWVVFIHIILITFVTLFLLTTTPASPDPSYRSHQISMWATFLGVTSAVLAAIQYAPQLTHTYKLKLVGAISIPMMIIQSPGAAFMVLSIALRPGTNWTSWVMYAVSGIMQGALLVMCLFWKARQRRLNIDDFGHPLAPEIRVYAADDIHSAVEDAIDDDVRVSAGGGDAESASAIVVGEETPLLGGSKTEQRKSWFSWFTKG